MRKDSILTSEGTFITGCNYWASHAGTAMWSDWRPDVVEKDLKLLAGSGLKVLRVFPLWPDFQPITLMCGEMGKPYETRTGEKVPGSDDMGRAGVSPLAMEHFGEFADIAGRYGIKLIVGLITGWMSGRLHVPTALQGRNILTDPLSLMWQVRFVKCFVGHFKACPAIAAWDLGNECNCMADVPGREAAWLWTAAIVDAIRTMDAERPVVSGMHSLYPEGSWTMQDQGELTDVLTTHPYPVFSPHCDLDPVNTMRNINHATAESLFNGDIAGKPCFAEEAGTLGPMVASDSIAADYARASMFSLWAHDCRGFLWWCANDQLSLEHSPYDWCAIERELGLVREDGTLKPVALEIGRFAKFIDGFSFGRLPGRLTEGVCILSEGQDQWGAAFSSFILSKQAGFDIRFQYHDQPLIDSSLYLVPCIRGNLVISRRQWLELMRRVREGAVLYISYDGGFISQFRELTGLEVQTRRRGAKPARVMMDHLPGCPLLDMEGEFRLDIKSERAQVLGTDEEGNPAFTCSSYGKGKVYFLAFPIEKELTERPETINKPVEEPYWLIYRELLSGLPTERKVSWISPLTGITEHPIDQCRRVVVLINYSQEAAAGILTICAGWELGEVLYGQVQKGSGGSLTGSGPGSNSAVYAVKGSDAVVFVIKKQE